MSQKVNESALVMATLRIFNIERQAKQLLN